MRDNYYEVDYEESYDAACEARRLTENGIAEPYIVVKDKAGKVIFNGKVGIAIQEHRFGNETPMKIGILWEDYKFPKYDSHDLMGLYFSHKHKMEYDNKVLTIFSNKGPVIMISL